MKKLDEKKKEWDEGLINTYIRRSSPHPHRSLGGRPSKEVAKRGCRSASCSCSCSSNTDVDSQQRVKNIELQPPASKAGTFLTSTPLRVTGWRIYVDGDDERASKSSISRVWVAVGLSLGWR